VQPHVPCLQNSALSSHISLTTHLQEVPQLHEALAALHLDAPLQPRPQLVVALDDLLQAAHTTVTSSTMFNATAPAGRGGSQITTCCALPKPSTLNPTNAP
jgi:hypothetical protein